MIPGGHRATRKRESPNSTYLRIPRPVPIAVVLDYVGEFGTGEPGPVGTVFACRKGLYARGFASAARSFGVSRFST